MRTRGFRVINPSSSDFLYDVMKAYGGCGKFYADFYMNFVCPLGLIRINSKGKEVNCNYYEYRASQELLYPFIAKQFAVKSNSESTVPYVIVLKVGKTINGFRSHPVQN